MDSKTVNLFCMTLEHGLCPLGHIIWYNWASYPAHSPPLMPFSPQSLGLPTLTWNSTLAELEVIRSNPAILKRNWSPQKKSSYLSKEPSLEKKKKKTLLPHQSALKRWVLYRATIGVKGSGNAYLPLPQSLICCSLSDSFSKKQSSLLFRESEECWDSHLWSIFYVPGTVFTSMTSFNLHNNPVTQVLLVPLSFSELQSPQLSDDLPKVTQGKFQKQDPTRGLFASQIAVVLQWGKERILESTWIKHWIKKHKDEISQ